MSYPKYGWVGNKISPGDMKVLYQLKLKNRKTITQMVAEAVRKYVAKRALTNR